ncbi:hypothetical protein [Campylobacter upsaliensis]|uniref:hypothetical protein n=1 Tax=Campylobacter upsaliensis TaxID=28080 RepID=UPI00214A45E4|nr:hypothetical protein [Campylobacter upsaliensis]MCR2099150.1 hypothetical protein [Campylobacter upsaliensis]
MKIYLNENINMDIIRYFSNKYPFITGFIYKNFAFELKRINLQELSFDYNLGKEEKILKIIKKLTIFKQETLLSFHQLSKEEKDFKQFKKEIFSQILTIALGKIDRKVYS